MRGTYVMRNGRLVEKQTAPPKGGVFVFSDIKPFATQDGTPIGGRAALREYEQRTGTRQVGTDINSEIARIKEASHGRDG